MGVYAKVLTMLLRKVPERTIGAVAEILPAAVAKLATAKSSPLIVALLSVFAQLVHTNAVQLIDYLAAAPSPGQWDTASLAGRLMLYMQLVRLLELAACFIGY